MNSYENTPITDDPELIDEEEIVLDASSKMGHFFRNEGYKQIENDSLTAENGACFEKDGIIVRINPNDQLDSGMEISISESKTLRTKVGGVFGRKPAELVRILANHGIYELGKKLRTENDGRVIYNLNHVPNPGIGASMRYGFQRIQNAPIEAKRKLTQARKNQASGEAGEPK